MEDQTTILTEPEIRVLGCLLEKEMATPEYYPLTLNALINACNQKTNREPVVAYDEEIVSVAIDDLKDARMVRQSNLGRAVKFEQIFAENRQLTPREKAIVCILLLRGPQTIGEVRGRTERLYSFSDLEEVRETFESLIDMELVVKLPMQPGRKEARYAHLLGDATEVEGDVTEASEATTSKTIVRSKSAETIARMEEEIAQLKAEFNQLREEFQAFKTQFE